MSKAAPKLAAGASPAKNKARPPLPKAGGSWLRQKDGGLAPTAPETPTETPVEASAADTPPAGKED
ncbi:MAG: hypothetical protein CML46_00060 [Rhodobacteraceae bacterium]|nr:hypothetical protein [Paracoccaceae bacterium]